MSKTKRPENKNASLTSLELEELSYYLKEQTSRNMESEFWGHRAGVMQGRILDRLGVDKNLFEIDWSRIMEGRISYKKKEAPSDQAKVS